MCTQLSSLTTAQLRRAADIKDRIEALNHELASILDVAAPVTVKEPKIKHGMSAAGRARVATAQKARWAKRKTTTPTTLSAQPAIKPAKKNKMSAEGRARIAAAQKARWAKIKGAKQA
jgi:hypothetical protein